MGVCELDVVGYVVECGELYACLEQFARGYGDDMWDRGCGWYICELVLIRGGGRRRSGRRRRREKVVDTCIQVFPDEIIQFTGVFIQCFNDSR